MKVNIPFKSRFKPVMLSGEKTWTSRTKIRGIPNDIFEIFGATFKITRLEKMPLSEVLYNWQKEGCESREDFIQIWKEIHPRKGFDPHQKVYVHKFKRIA